MKEKKVFSTAVLMILFFVFHIVVFRGKLDTDISIIKRILSAILAIVFTLPAHEFIHCFFMKIFGLKDIRIETARDPLGFISLRTTASGKTYGWKNIGILLGPFMMLTIIPDVVFVFMNDVPFGLWIVSLANSAGCCFDLLALMEMRNGG